MEIHITSFFFFVFFFRCRCRCSFSYFYDTKQGGGSHADGPHVGLVGAIPAAAISYPISVLLMQSCKHIQRKLFFFFNQKEKEDSSVFKRKKIKSEACCF